MRPSACIATILLSATALAEESVGEIGGHTKLNLTHQSYSGDSLLRDLRGSDSSELQGDLRLNLGWRNRGWSIDVDYQLVGLQNNDGVVVDNPVSAILSGRVPDDSRRFFDMTKVISDSNDNAVLHRLDRLSAAYTNEKTVIRLGRQALSWGNGLFYAPMDLVNPFDPAAIDTEYKAGDDMLYAQYLKDNGDDVQAAVVVRRDPLTGDVESSQSTSAIKYHGFANDFEYDLLVAESYSDTVIGLGASRGIGGAHWGADLTLANTGTDTRFQAVTNLSYSWVLGGRNMIGIVEYYFNGFGQRSRQYSPSELARNGELLDRLTRGQSFTLGRHYLAGSLSVEMTPLWTVSPLLLANLVDPSALLQLTSSYSLSDNLALLGSVNVPVGADGTEYGGIGTGMPGRYLSISLGVFAQIAWYF